MNRAGLLLARSPLLMGVARDARGRRFLSVPCCGLLFSLVPACYFRRIFRFPTDNAQILYFARPLYKDLQGDFAGVHPSTETRKLEHAEFAAAGAQARLAVLA
jgi:hypothetical protein